MNTRSSITFVLALSLAALAGCTAPNGSAPDARNVGSVHHGDTVTAQPGFDRFDRTVADARGEARLSSGSRSSSFSKERHTSHTRSH